MTKNETNAFKTGLEQSATPRYHFDIYAILEGSQEMYFGKEVAVNINLVETVKLAGEGKEIEKCYISPTKRRGVERRTLIWAPVAEGVLLGDREGCGIPETCARQNCPICSIFGALQPKEKTSLIGRLTHGGGVAVQPLLPEVKQRAMHPSMVTKDEKSVTPMPFRREYNEPGLLYPVYNHCLSITDQEFDAVAYAFLGSLGRLGASNPKGVGLAEDVILGDAPEPLLVVDRYLAPLGKRPVVSPLISDAKEAIAQFRSAAMNVFGQVRQERVITEGEEFRRWIGVAAMRRLQEGTLRFTREVLRVPVPAAQR
jgi:hypothetical protein